ncbi:MAG: SurA N-terminal domain-containing protein [Candidatus Omnitrophica bacterium]|nr:SurA N-terminal domain-containing protein [Candidatus Omnitrophota bacterium]
MKKLTVFLLGLFLSVFVTVSLAYSEDRQLVDRVVAVVNDDVITQSELDLLFRPIYEQVKAAYQGSNLQEELEGLRLKLLNQLIEDRLVYQEAVKLGITVSDSELQEEMAQFKSQFPDEAQFENEMKKAGVSQTEIEKRFRERITIMKLHQGMIRSKVMIAPTEIEEYYKAHPEEFSTKERLNVWCITLPKNEETIKKGMMDEEAKRKAADLIAKIKQGADFGKLAQENSKDSYAEKGGLMGIIHRGEMLNHIDQILFLLPEGGVSEVLETEEAYHIFKVSKKERASQKTFEEAREEITEKLYRKKAHERFTTWMDELKKKSYISIR